MWIRFILCFALLPTLYITQVNRMTFAYLLIFLVIRFFFLTIVRCSEFCWRRGFLFCRISVFFKRSSKQNKTKRKKFLLFFCDLFFFFLSQFKPFGGVCHFKYITSYLSSPSTFNVVVRRHVFTYIYDFDLIILKKTCKIFELNVLLKYIPFRNGYSHVNWYCIVKIKKQTNLNELKWH